MSRTTLPNLFLPGAPKSGTTAVWRYLGAHPDIFFCNPKEPRHFDPGSCLPQYRSESAYRLLFASPKAQPARYRGDASTTYLASPVAIEAIERTCDQPLYIVCLRNPIDLCHALHWEHVLQGIENVHDFWEAWELQKERRAGERLPTSCPDPRLLLYRDLASIGRQVERMLTVVPRERVIFVLAEALRSQPRACYLEVLGFLGVHDDGRIDFPSINRSSVPRSWLLHHLVSASVRLKKRLGIGYFGDRLNSIYRKINRAEKRRPALDESERKLLADVFRNDVRTLGRKAGLELGAYWPEFSD